MVYRIFILFLISVSCYCQNTWYYTNVNNTVQDDTLDLFIFYHQSNMNGQGANDSVTGGSRYAAYLTTNYGYYWQDTLGILQDLSINNSRTTSPYTFHGPDVPFAVKYYQTFGKRCIVLKYAIGGTDMNSDWQPTTNYLFDTIFNSKLQKCTTYLNANFYKWRYGGVVGSGGEQDAIEQIDSATYHNAFQTFIDSSYTYTKNNIIHVYTRLHSGGTYAATADIDTIRLAQEGITEQNQNAQWVNVDDQGFRDSGTHWNALGTKTAGERLFDAWYNLKYP